jgi:hypothetical protein
VAFRINDTQHKDTQWRMLLAECFYSVCQWDTKTLYDIGAKA